MAQGIAVVCQNCHYQNPPGANFCNNCGMRLAAPAEDERRLATVLFADIADFSLIAESLDLEQVTHLTNEVFSELRAVVQALDGAVDKYIGDAMMVLFGVPKAHEDDPARALRCALAMLDCIARYNEAHGDELPAPIALHISVNSGLVVAAPGDGERVTQGYSVLGDAVNVASQLERQAGRNEILVGDATHQLTQPLFDWIALGTVTIRGKSAGVPVYRLLRAHEEGESGRGLAGLYTPLIGRAKELAAATRAIQRVGEGHDAVIGIIGDVGMGKTRLLTEAFLRVRNATPSEGATRRKRYTGPLSLGPTTARLLIAEGRCLNYGLRSDYQPWQEIARELLDIGEGDSEQALAQLRTRLAEFGFDDKSSTFIQLGRLLGLVSEPGPSDPNIRTTEIATAFTNLFVSLVSKHSLVITLEDLHWADQPSLDLLTQVVSIVGGLPILFFMVSRPVGEAAEVINMLVRNNVSGQRIELQPLTDTEVTTLVCRLLAIKGLPASVSKLLSRAEGNPFYVEEIVRTLLERGNIVPGEDGWRIGDTATAEVPNTLQGIIGTRIDTLPAGPRRALRVASVLGRNFNVDELAALDRMAAQPANLQALVERGLLLPGAEGNYSFHHVLTQEVAYSTLLLERRKHYHHAAAEHCLSEPIPDPPHAIADLTTLLTAEYHYAMAGDYGEAYELLSRIVDGEENIAFFRRLFLWGELTTIVEVLSRLATTGALGCLDEIAQAEVLSNLGLAYAYMGNAAKATYYADMTIPLTQDAGISGLGVIYNRLGVIYAILGDLNRAVMYYEQALSASESEGDNTTAARSLNNLALAYLKLGKMRVAQEYSKRALEYSEQSGDLDNQGILLNNLGVLSVALGQLYRAIEYYKRALAISEQLNHQQERIVALNDLGATYLDIGDIDNARACHQLALQLSQEVSDVRGYTAALSLLGEDYTALNDYEVAMNYHKQAIEALNGLDDPLEKGEVLLGVAGTYLRMGEQDTSLSYYEEALDCFVSAEDLLHQASTLVSLAATYNTIADKDKAFNYAQRARDLAEQIEAPLILASAYHQLGEAQQALGDIAAARSSFVTAVELRTRYEDRRVAESKAALENLDKEESSSPV